MLRRAACVCLATRARGGGLARAVGELLEGGDAVVERQARVEEGTCEENKGTKRRHPSTHTLCVRTGAAGVTACRRVSQVPSALRAGAHPICRERRAKKTRSSGPKKSISMRLSFGGFHAAASSIALRSSDTPFFEVRAAVRGDLSGFNEDQCAKEHLGRAHVGLARLKPPLGLILGLLLGCLICSSRCMCMVSLGLTHLNTGERRGFSSGVASYLSGATFCEAPRVAAPST